MDFGTAVWLISCKGMAEFRKATLRVDLSAKRLLHIFANESFERLRYLGLILTKRLLHVFANETFLCFL